MGSMRILSRAGDERLDWDPDDPAAVARAKAEFERLQGEGYNLYEVAEVKGKLVKKFNPRAGKLLAAPGARTPEDKASGRRAGAMAGGPVDRGAPLR